MAALSTAFCSIFYNFEVHHLWAQGTAVLYMFCFAFSLILYGFFFLSPPTLFSQNSSNNFLLCSFTFILLFDGNEKKILLK